ncbi:hypothetical protein ABKP09_25935 [Peribacillus frigoritolerans]|uniref:hypothetical protein n=1 Tax=Peribacillus frigoritolerans TaxID=450367 RepID=UPI0032B5850E
MLSGRIENFKEYSQFDSLKAFNNTIEMFLAEHKKDFTKGELVAFKRLVRFSAKYVGVANAKIGTLLKAINEKLNGFGISRSTFERMLRKAKELGILSIENTVKSKGGKGHNVYIFNKIDVSKKRKMTYCEKAETSTGPKDNSGKFQEETINLFESSKNNINKRIEHDPVLDKSLNHSFVSDYVPKEFTNLVKFFFDDAKTIEEYWRMVKFDTHYIQHILDEDTILHTAIHSFKQMISKLKKGKVKNPIAYFKGVLHKQISDAY